MKTTFFTLLLLTAASAVAQAALFDYGNGQIYDDVLYVTWLQDANYEQTSKRCRRQDELDRSQNLGGGINLSGYRGKANEVYRLPYAAARKVNTISFSCAGNRDIGNNITSPKMLFTIRESKSHELRFFI